MGICSLTPTTLEGGQRLRTGLVLTGGGARAAYQAGALRALAEILKPIRTPFPILTGVSAGAINSAFLASRADSFEHGTSELWKTWSQLTPEQVYRTDVRSLSSIGSRWLRELTSGGLLGPGRVNHLLDTSPLRKLLQEKLNLTAIHQHLERGTLRAVAVSATNYHSGTAITFYDADSNTDPKVEPWARSMRLGKPSVLRLEHVLASSAIPVFFSPVEIDGAFFGDGCVRLASPLSPAIHLGAEAIVAIGVRYFRSAQRTAELNEAKEHLSPSLSEVGGMLLNAVFLDSLDGDVERLERINRTLSLMHPEPRLSSSLRQIPILVLRPSKDLGHLAERQDLHFPRTMRYLLRGIGVRNERGGDLLSYLAFAPNYISQLLELGYNDTLARRTDIEQFFSLQAPSTQTH